MFLPVEPNDRVVNSQQDFDVVVVLSGVAAAADGLVHLPGDGDDGPGNVQIRFWKRDERDEVRKQNLQ